MKFSRRRARSAAPRTAAGPRTLIQAMTLVAGFPVAYADTPAANKEQNASQLEEVVVTAQRREQSAQDVAISMTVFSQEQLSDANMVNSADLALLTPSLSVNNTFGPENASFTIRGFTQELRTTASVGVYFAEVVAPRGQNVRTSGDGAGPGTLFDLQNVQVLKGPQGTLFGRNTTGGAVLMSPQKPHDEFGGYIELSTGNYAMLQKQAVVNIPMGDRLKLRLGIDSLERDGHLNNVTGIGADNLGNANYTARRLGLVFDVTDSLENYLLVNHSKSDTKGYAPAVFACNTRDSAADNPILLFTVQGCQDQLEMQRQTGQDGFYDLVSTVPEPVNFIDELRVINTITWDLPGEITLKNILAYANLETISGADIFGTQFPESQAALLGVGLPAGLSDPNREYTAGVSMPNPDRSTTSQQTRVAELQLHGSALEQRLQWQAGLYYENSTPDEASGANSPILISCELATIQSRNPADFNCFDPLNGALGGVLVHDLKTEYENRAAFGQATYDFNEQFSLTGGIRYTQDVTEGRSNRTIYRFTGNLMQAPTVVYTNPKQESEAPTGLLELQYRPTPEVMVYLKAVRGYRQGGVNLAADAGVDTHGEEKVDTWELGAKTEFDWLIPGRFNIAIFDNDFTDMQMQTGYVSPSAGPTTALFNAGEARIQGVEFDGMLQLLEGLTLSFGYAWLDTELVEQDQSGNQEKVEAAGGPIAGMTFVPSADVGDELPFTPERSWNLTLNYRLPVAAEVGRISVGATYAYTGMQRVTASSDSPFSVLGDFAVLNMNLRWADIFSTPLDLSLFVTNVNDTEYETYRSGSYSALGFDSRLPGLPRMYGARLKYSF